MEEKIAFTPLNDWVLVEPIKDEPITAGILHTADQAIKKEKKGTILAVGPGRLLAARSYSRFYIIRKLQELHDYLFPSSMELFGVEVGDRLFHQQNGSVEININNRDLLLVNKSQFMGLFK